MEFKLRTNIVMNKELTIEKELYSNCEFLTLYADVACDSPVPYYDMGISCGLPNEMGDVPPEMMMVPDMLTTGRTVSFVRAQGDSMIGVNIHDGDLLMVERVCRFSNQDIVAAKVNGRDVLKSYYVDEEGRHWLVPANERYDAILLTEDMDVRFVGKMVWNMQRDVHDTTRNIRQSIRRMLNKMGETREEARVPTREEVERALLQMGSQVEKGRHWLGACRVLMDRQYIPKGRYDLFCDLVCRVLPDHQHLPLSGELQRMAVDCFAKPFQLWTDEKAPVHGHRYHGYHAAGEAMANALP